MAGNVVMDAGVVIAAARGEASARRYLEVILEEDEYEVVVPAVVVAETIRGDGARDAPVNRILNGSEIIVTDEGIARRAGVLLAQSGSSATVDSIIVATAAALVGPCVIVTRDPDDLRALASRTEGVRIDVR